MFFCDGFMLVVGGVKGLFFSVFLEMSVLKICRWLYVLFEFCLGVFDVEGGWVVFKEGSSGSWVSV